ncbi:MAG: hypothetical protein IJ150_10445 [Bacteroidales bacterium]|nr:hypothetical protein [Bacteroidales bacterium]
MRWIKLYDSLLNWRWAHKPEYMAFVIHCLLRANPSAKKWENLELERGSFIVGREDFAKEIGISVQTYRTILKNLQACEFLTAKSTSKGTIITICNYDSYQEVKKQNNQQITNASPSNHQLLTETSPTNHQLLTTIIDNKNNREQNFKDKEIKETFLKNGGTAEKKVFQISDLEKILSAENIYMTAQGYQEFKNLNESDDRYGYKGGVIRSAKIFLKNPKNAIYRKNPPPPPQQTLPQPDKKAVEVWEKAKNLLAEEMMPKSFETWILPIVPLKLESETLKIQVPSAFFREYLEKNYIQQLRKALNDNGIKKIIYSITKN